jgi:putative zinc finger protein
MTCNEVRELLPEHLLDTLEPSDSIEVRRHIRGCASCRAEMHGLGDGLTTFARAAHDRRPPAELRDRVLIVLEEEWRDSPVLLPEAGRKWNPLAAAAVFVLLVASVGWGVAQNRRANDVAEDARSYQTILNVLGGEDFRIGTVRAAGPQQIQGSVVLYDAHTDQSWGLVIVRAPGMLGRAHATLTSIDGSTMELNDLEFDKAGHASAWFVRSGSVKSFGHLSITTRDGVELATADISSA